ncbi:MAG: preprotein translocase, YajC subunit [Thermoleophilia bacterium]|nr:preprotein translocase, YajC subunit [Thermoleophilia bacterium]
MLPLLVLLGTIAGAWYLLIVRPQKDQQARHGAVLSQLQVDDHVLTVGGIYGRVAAVEGSTVVLELAPGLTSRIASDGIARIVQGPEAALPAVPAAPAPLAETAPPLQAAPISPPMQTPAPQVPAMHQHQPHQPYQPYPEQQPLVTHDGAGTVTMRAEVLPATPWSDVARVNAHAAPYGGQPAAQQLPASGPTMPAPQPQHAAPQQYAPPAQYQQHAMPQQVAPPAPQSPYALQAAAPRADFLPPPPVIMPFGRPAPLQQPVMPQQQFAPQQQVAPQFAAPQQQFVQAAQPHYAQAAAPLQQEVAPPPHAPSDARRHSQAPKGMGSDLRLDDPSIADTMERARQERESLAVEYRQVMAPLVDTSTAAPAAPPTMETQQFAAVQHAPGGPQMFVQQPMQAAPHGGMPGMAHDAGGLQPMMPRPHVQAPSEHVDPALTSAFQRPTPYAPAHGGTAPQPTLA